MKVRYSEGVAIHTDPESCAGHCREAVREALIGGPIGEVWSGESMQSGVPMPSWQAEGTDDRRSIRAHGRFMCGWRRRSGH